MDFIYAKDLKNNDRERVWNDLVLRTKKNIQDANNEGLNSIVFSGIIYDRVTKQYFDFEFELEKLLKKYGFRIQNTGCIGGVWQKTKDVCW